MTSASICCGAHAGSRDVIRQTLRDAAACGVVVGAHPGYPDREGFGRRDQNLPRNEVVDLIRGQVSELIGLAEELDVDSRLPQAARSIVQPGPAATGRCRPGRLVAAEISPFASVRTAGQLAGSRGSQARRAVRPRGIPRPALPR